MKKTMTQNLQGNANLPESVVKLKSTIDWCINIFFDWSVYNLDIIKNYMNANIKY